MTITERLKVEHGIFLRQLRYLEDLLAKGASPESIVASVETIAVAEEYHSALEDKLFYPALSQVVGDEVPALRDVDADHRALRDLFAAVRAGDTRAQTVRRLIDALFNHMEKEIHTIFPLAEEFLSEYRLTSLCRWDTEHVFDSVGQAEAWIEELASESTS